MKVYLIKLDKLDDESSHFQMVNASALDLAKAALASGASPEQVALMMHQSGASQAEMSQVQRAVQDHVKNKGE